ncbi:ACP S-malonyltransferase [Brevibacillus dissolubilis]|uniref:ACP S-malonyltransferase n=1 Tax=Brevibacillus dissolubilis TaxID=1844116 RepID=UPI0011165892|nr:ACP S-malonyltransferase [Brevibacillus dissolubilis]
MLAYLFPGQGSQAKGMGAGLFEAYQSYTDKASEILGYSIRELCEEDPQEQLGLTQFTQPALYVVNALHYLKKLEETDGLRPDYVAGHSLGEYNALLAAEVFDFETGLRLVKKRSELMAEANGGGMAAVVGLKEEQVLEVLQKHHLDKLDVANFNSVTQIVISGTKEAVEEAQPFFEAAGVRAYVILKVSGAFHSRYMTPSAEEFAKFLDGFAFSEPNIPIISNLTARPYLTRDIKTNLAQQINHSVKWTETIRYLMGKAEEGELIQVGPGNVLTGLVRQIRREAEPLIVTDEVQDDTDEVVESAASAEFAAGNPETITVKAEVSEEAQPTGAEPYVAAAQAPSADQTSDPAPTAQDSTAHRPAGIQLQALGSRDLKHDYNLTYPYLASGLEHGISSKEMVVQMAKAGMLGFFGTAGLQPSEIERTIRAIQSELTAGQAYGVTLTYNLNDPKREDRLVELFLSLGVRIIEASAYMNLTPALVRYRLQGLRRDVDGQVKATNRIIVKAGRPEVAEPFLRPAPETIINKLLADNLITREQAELSRQIPMADDICATADAGGYTDLGSLHALLPVILGLREQISSQFPAALRVRIGAAGGIGTPSAVASVFMQGAEFIMTGSINQCTVEAATSTTVKDMLQQMNIDDITHAPYGDMFEIGAKAQVLKKGLFYPARANKLYDLYRQHNSWNEIDAKTRAQLEEKYFKRTFDQMFTAGKNLYAPHEIEKAEKNAKHKMALVFRCYIDTAMQLAIQGDSANKLDYQVHVGPSLGACNNWLKGTELENWRNRHVDQLAVKLMNDAVELINQRLLTWFMFS